MEYSMELFSWSIHGGFRWSLHEAPSDSMKLHDHPWSTVELHGSSIGLHGDYEKTHKMCSTQEAAGHGPGSLSPLEIRACKLARGA